MRLPLSQSIITGLLVTLSIYSSRCRLPGLWEPDQDSIIDPPTSPRLLQPGVDTVIWYQKAVYVPFDWTLVEDAEEYQIDADTAGSFVTSMMTTVETPPVIVSRFVGLGVHQFQTYYGRVRAVNRRWRNGVTGWSETRTFTLKYQIGK